MGHKSPRREARLLTLSFSTCIFRSSSRPIRTLSCLDSPRLLVPFVDDIFLRRYDIVTAPSFSTLINRSFRSIDSVSPLIAVLAIASTSPPSLPCNVSPLPLRSVDSHLEPRS